MSPNLGSISTIRRLSTFSFINNTFAKLLVSFWFFGDHICCSILLYSFPKNELTKIITGFLSNLHHINLTFTTLMVSLLLSNLLTFIETSVKY